VARRIPSDLLSELSVRTQGEAWEELEHLEALEDREHRLKKLQDHVEQLVG